jgi:DNA-binding NarL/FixJ family response regulator
MISKVLIAEDHESVNISVRKTLEELHIDNTDYAYYCDDALQKIQTAKVKNEPYELLITDLHFDPDGTPQELSGGQELIVAARFVQPELKVLVFSADSRANVIEGLFEKHSIDGFVRKARHDSKELKTAISIISNNQRYFPRHLTQLIKQKNSHNFTEYDIIIITLLSQGMLQKDIPAYLKKNNIQPSGISSLEKRLNLIRDALEFTKNEQLVAFCKDMGII